MLICKVCQKGRVLQGYWLCEACRSFLRRNRNNLKLSCITGLNQCLKSDTILKCGRKNKYNSKHRKLCKKCRLDKCLELQTSISQDKIEKGPTDIEHILITIVNTSFNFQQHLKQLHYRK